MAEISCPNQNKDLLPSFQTQINLEFHMEMRAGLVTKCKCGHSLSSPKCPAAIYASIHTADKGKCTDLLTVVIAFELMLVPGAQSTITVPVRHSSKVMSI